MMKRLFIVFLVMVVIGGVSCSNSKDPGTSQKKPGFETERQKTSYSVGYRLGVNLQSMVKHNDIDLDLAMQGVKDAAAGQPQLPEPEMQKIYAEFKKELQKRQAERRKILAYKNKTEGEAFLKENAAKEGIVVTGSGLQYKILKQGTGPVPKETDIAVVHYRGTLLDGTEIFNTYKRGKPVQLPVKRSLPAWREGLQLMKVGARYVFFIPPELAYKQHGRPPLINANAVLIYEAELLGIE
jgi:FKBP-type peptidyl-prolyl cis-trans isomerase